MRVGEIELRVGEIELRVEERELRSRGFAAFWDDTDHSPSSRAVARELDS